MREHRIIIGPVETEKSNLQREKNNQVSFEVAPDANRVEIKKAVEKLFNVRVKSVNTMHVRGKTRRRGRYVGKTRRWKKAIVTLAPGSRIEYFEGV